MPQQLTNSTQFINNAVEPIYWFDTCGRIIFANPAACKESGYSHEELLKLSLIDIDKQLSESDWPDFFQKISSGEYKHYQSIHRRNDGSEYPVFMSFSYLTDAPDSICMFVHNGSVALKSEGYKLPLQYAVDTAVDAFFLITTRDNRIHHVNQGACKLLGYSFDELTSMVTSDIDPSVKPVEKGITLGDQLLTDKQGTFETEHLRKDGSKIAVEISYNNILLGDEEYSFSYARDITERKEAEKRQQELRYIIDNASDAVYLYDQDGRIHYVNERACSDLGYRRDELLGLSIMDIDPSLTKEEWIEHRQRIREDQDLVFEKTHQRKDGSSYPVEISVFSTIFEGSEHFCAFVRNITSRKEAYRVAEELRFAVENSFDPVYIFNKAGNIHYANDKACAELGYTREELLNLTISDIDTDYLLENRDRDWEMHQKSEASWIFETRHRKKDGSFIPVEISVNSTVIDGEEYACAFVRDITSRKETYRMAEELRFAVENSFDPVYILNKDGSIHYVNDRCCKELGYSHDELMTMTIFDIDTDYPREKWDLEWEHRQQGLVPSLFETRHRKKDGSYIPVEISANTRAIEGVEYAYAIVRNISERKQAMQQLEILQFAIDNSIDPFYFYDDKANITYANKSGCNALGYSLEEILKLTVYDIDPGITPELWNNLYSKVKEGTVGTIQSFNRRKDQTIFPVEVTPTNMTFGDIEFGCSVNRDVSDRIEAENALRESEEKFRLIADTSPVALIIHRASDGIVIYANNTAEKLFRKQANEIIGGPVISLYDNPDSRNEFINILGTCEHTYGHEFMLSNHDHIPLWVSLSTNTITMQGEKVVCSALLDITEAHELSMQLSYQASYDVLTGLVNRREFETRLQRVINTAKKNKTENALCYMDLDQFKVINDTCGHIAGDNLLRQLGQFLQLQIRKRDTLARLGGDEFAVLLENCSLQQAERVANVIRESIQEFRFIWENNVFNIGASIGLVPLDQTDETIDDVMRRVDAACYHAKENGRNKVHVYVLGDEELIQREGEMRWVTRVSSALEQNRLQLWSQDIIPLEDEQDNGEHYELLIRLIDEKGNSVLPGTFLPAAERYNLITQIDKWVISNIMAWFTQHSEKYNKLGLCSINISGQSLNNADFLQEIISNFDKYSLAPDKFCFEVTETAAISNLSSATFFIKSLKELGCSFALDDFGRGLSSFAYLKNLPVDFIKIDGMFVEDILEDPVHMALVNSINEVGHMMGKKTIAEFVEKKEIIDVLKELGVDYAQGYGIKRPELLSEGIEVEKINKLHNVAGK